MNKSSFKSFLLLIAKWLLLCALTALSGGVLGAAFAKCISLVTGFRTANGWIILLLPVGGLLSVIVYRIFKIKGMGTNQVIKSVEGASELSPLLAPCVFLGSCISHLFGASVGREGAALQLGGSLATLISKIFKLNDNERHILLQCGMAGLFSALFGTPLAATLFALEVICVGSICFRAVIPTVVTSLLSFCVATALGVHPERFTLTALPDFSLIISVKSLLIILLATLLSVVFCFLLHLSERVFERLFKNDFLQIFVGGICIVLLTISVGNQDYNGAGVNIIEQIFTEGEVKYTAFIFKIIFTCIAVAAGFKGGEIVPTLFIGATFGAALGIALGLPPSFGAALGMTALFCGVTNCPLATVLLSLEMFSFKGAPYIIAAAAISFVLSGKISLYSAQQNHIPFIKGKKTA